MKAGLRNGGAVWLPGILGVKKDDGAPEPCCFVGVDMGGGFEKGFCDCDFDGDEKTRLLVSGGPRWARGDRDLTVLRIIPRQLGEGARGIDWTCALVFPVHGALESPALHDG